MSCHRIGFSCPWVWAYFYYHLYRKDNMSTGSGCRMHPHGVLCVSAWATYASDGAGFSEKFPGIDMRVGAHFQFRNSLL